MEVLVGRDYRASGAAVLDDNAPLRTDSAYSLSKALMETLAQEISHQRGCLHHRPALYGVWIQNQ